MSCYLKDTSRFIVVKGLDNTFVFTIKGNGTTLPLEIQPNDSFMAHFRDKESGNIILSKEMDVVSASEGKVTLLVDSNETYMFDGVKGGKVDRFYLKPNYSLLLECDTQQDGKFIARVEDVYID